MAELRKSGEEKWLRPDSKTQVTAEHQIVGGAIVPVRVHTVVISVQHSDDISNEDMRAILREKVLLSFIRDSFFTFNLPGGQPRHPKTILGH